jgi:two-component system, chemotaxis family, protein-glutamate methylesterase/glutaminase
MTMPQPTPSFAAKAFDAIVIGASAGGVELLRRLLGALPPTFGASVLIVLHRPPHGGESLIELLASDCALPVQEALDKQPVMPGNVYIAPPDYHLMVEPGGTLALSIDPPVLYSRPAIDPLFESAAALYGRRLLALLLSGASSDGSAGIASVREHGGTAWVQDPATAYAPTMPASAIARAGADRILDIDQLCQGLIGMGCA